MQANRKGLAINLEKDFGMPEMLTTDENRLEQILINLLINAVKYTQKGTITLRITRDNQEPSSILFQVADTGIGMTRERKQEIFESFSEESISSFLEEKVDKSKFFLKTFSWISNYNYKYALLFPRKRAKGGI